MDSIQWTSKKRYVGLGIFANNYDGDPMNWELNLGIWLTNLSGQSMNFI